MKRFLALLLCLCLFVPSALADDVDALLRNAEDFLEADDIIHAEACMALFEMCAVIDATQYVEAGAVYYLLGNKDAAGTAIDRALALDPLNEEAWYARAVLACENSDYAAYDQAVLYLEALRAPEGLTASLRMMHQSAIAPRNEALDALFATGSVSLTETDLFLGAQQDMTGAMAMSISPDGQRVIVLQDQQWYIWDRLSLTLTQLTHDTTRGVQGEGNLLDDMFLQRPQPSFALQTSFTWSPDGRFAVPINSSCANHLQNYLPVLIDTHSATAALLAGKELIQAHGGCMVNAAFTADGYGLVYALYSNASSLTEVERLMYNLSEDAVSAVMYYDFASDEITRLMDADGYDWAAGMGHVAGTSSLVTVDQSTHYPCMVTIQDGMVSTVSLADSAALVMDDYTMPLDGTLYYSPVSGRGLCSGALFRKLNDQWSSYYPSIPFVAIEDAMALGDTVLLTSITDYSIHTLTQDDFRSVLESGQFRSSQHPLIALSPDGRYAAVYYFDLVLMDLETGETVSMVLPKEYPLFQSISWTAPDTLLVMTTGPSRSAITTAFTLQ